MALAAPAGADLPGTDGPVGALIGRPTWRWFDVRRWGRRRLGVAAVIVVFGALGMLNALTVPPLVPRDETGHVAYVVSITHGVLPTIYTPLPKDDVPQLRTNHKDTTWVANHPPLFYVLAAVPMKVALMVHRPMLGLRLIRLMNVGFVMLTMALAAVLARRLLRRSGRAPIVAAATTGLVSTVPHTAAMLYNDARGHADRRGTDGRGGGPVRSGPDQTDLGLGRRLRVSGRAEPLHQLRRDRARRRGRGGGRVASSGWTVSRRATAVLRAGVIVAVPVALDLGVVLPPEQAPVRRLHRCP